MEEVFAAGAAALGLFPDWNTWQLMLAACAPPYRIYAISCLLPDPSGGKTQLADVMSCTRWLASW